MQSESIVNIVKARIAAVAEIRNANKNAKNPHLGNTYANLSSVLEAIQPISQFGMTLFHLVDGTNEEVRVTCMLVHESGEFLSCTLGVKPDKNNAQGIGSAITYARRYTAAAMLGITQEDDDGNEASGVREDHGNKPTRAAKPTAKPSAKSDDKTEAAVDELVKLLGDARTDEDLKALMPRLSAAKAKKDSISRYSDIIDAFHAAKKRMGAEE